MNHLDEGNQNRVSEGRRPLEHALLGLALVVLVAGCGPPTKHELLARAEGAETKQQLEAALGPPSDRSKLGPIETWKYVARDGEVTFVIAGDRVRFETAGGSPSHAP
jgi:hypothetical protein